MQKVGQRRSNCREGLAEEKLNHVFQPICLIFFRILCFNRGLVREAESLSFASTKESNQIKSTLHHESPLSFLFFTRFAKRGIQAPLSNDLILVITLRAILPKNCDARRGVRGVGNGQSFFYKCTMQVLTPSIFGKPKSFF